MSALCGFAFKKPVITHTSFTHRIVIGNFKLDYSKYILFGLFLMQKFLYLFRGVSGTPRTPGCNDKDFGNVRLHGVHHRDGGWCSRWIRNEYVRGSILSSGPVLR